MLPKCRSQHSTLFARRMCFQGAREATSRVGKQSGTLRSRPLNASWARARRAIAAAPQPRMAPRCGNRAVIRRRLERLAWLERRHRVLPLRGIAAVRAAGGGRPRRGRRAPWRWRARSTCSPAEASWRIRGRGRPEAPPIRRRAGVGVGRPAGAASPSESMGGPPDMGVYDVYLFVS